MKGDLKVEETLCSSSLLEQSGWLDMEEPKAGVVCWDALLHATPDSLLPATLNIFLLLLSFSLSLHGRGVQHIHSCSNYKTASWLRCFVFQSFTRRRSTVCYSWVFGFDYLSRLLFFYLFFFFDSKSKQIILCTYKIIIYIINYNIKCKYQNI